MDIRLARKTAVECAQQAGALLTKNREKVKKVSFKGKSDIVTEIDIAAEKLIVNKITNQFPGHAILSEETGFIEGHSNYEWIIDPIDGTINYYHDSPPYRVGVCLLENRKPLISAIFNPVKNELYYAERGKGTTLNGRRIVVNANFELKNSVVMTHISSKKEARARTILALESIFNKTLHMRMFGSGLAAMCYVAMGKFDVFFNVKTNPWDILPGTLLIEEAGGVVSDIQGKKITHESTSVLATNGKVHEQMLKLLEDI